MGEGNTSRLKKGALCLSKKWGEGEGTNILHKKGVWKGGGWVQTCL